jgi:hypothetical protein
LSPGYREVTLWVLDTDERARRFYEAGGWRTDGTSRTDESRGSAVVAVRYRYRRDDRRSPGVDVRR